MAFRLPILIAWLALVCRALGSITPSLPVGAVLLERVSQLRPVYDYVIVGGGTGGLAIAARLAESTNTSVAVIEAGGFYQIDNGAGRLVLHGLQI